MHFKVLSENFISTFFLFQLSSKKRTQSYANEGYCWEDETIVELVSKELNHLSAILHVYAGSLIFMK